MSSFAVLEGTLIINTIIAESKAIAEQITGKTCVAYTNEPAEIDGTYINGKFIKKQPYPSWVREGESFWTAPVEYPEVDPENIKHYTWDEETVSWVETV
jgi:hypothetical protein